MRNLMALAAVLMLTGCDFFPRASVGEPTIGQPCKWVKPIELSGASLAALRSAQATNPEVRADREAIASHNAAYYRLCEP